MTYLLTLASPTPGLPRFLKSREVLEGVEFLDIRFNTFPGHIKKWEHVPKVLKDQYVVFSDTDDVIFQKSFPEFTHDLYLAPENVTHDETIWKEHIEQFPAFSELMYKEVYNCGTFAMSMKTLYEYQHFMMTFKDGGYRSWGLEQMYFNMFVHLRKDLSRVADLSIFCPLYRNLNDGWVEKTDVWRTNGKTISTVHANGTKELKEQL